MNWIHIDIIAFLTVVILAVFIIPQIMLIAFRKNLFQDVNPLKIHKGTVPQLGGIAFFHSIFLSLLFIMGLRMLDGKSTIIEIFLANLAILSFVGCATIILYLICDPALWIIANTILSNLICRRLRTDVIIYK